MKKPIRTVLRALVVFWLTSVVFSPAKAQTLQPNYGAPTAPVSVCNDNAQFKVKIIGSSAACASATLDIQLPTGYRYTSGSATVTAGTGTLNQVSVSGNTAELTVLNIPASPDSTVITYVATADCSAIGTSTTGTNNAKYTLTSPCLGTYVVTSNTFNTQSAALSFTNITNGAYVGAVGDNYTRAVTITNNGLGTVSQITFVDTSGSGFLIGGFSVNNGWSVTHTKQAYGIDTIHTFVLQGASLSQGQQIVLTENISLVNKCYLQSSLFAYFGCNSTPCTNNNVSATATAAASVNTSLAPNLKVIATTSALICRGTAYPQTIAFANIGNAPLYNLNFNLFSSTWSAVASTQYFAPTRSYTSGGQSAYTNIQYKVGVNGTWASFPMDSTKSFTTPGSSVVGLPASIYATVPMIKAGDTLYLNYNELNSPLPGINSGNTMEVSGGLLRYTYSDGCGGTTSPVAQFVRNYVQVRMNLTTNLPANMEVAQTYPFAYTFTESNTGIYVYTGATGSTVRFDLLLPPKVQFTGTVSDITLKTAGGASYGTPSSFSYNVATNTISVTYKVTSSGWINGMLGCTLIFDKMTLNCAAAGTGTVAQLNCYLKAQTGCSNEEQFFALNTNVGLVCPVPCSTAGGMNFTGFKLTRTTLGSPDNDNNGVADGSGSVNPSLAKMNYAMVGDTMMASFSGQVVEDVATPSGGFKYAYAVDTFSSATYATYISNLYAKVQIFSSGSTTPYYTSGNLSLTGSGTSRTVNLSLSALTGYPYTKFNNGDSVVVQAFYKITGNVGGVITAVTLSNGLYFTAAASQTSTPQYRCGGNYTGNLTLVGWGAGAGTGNLTYSISGNATAATQASNVGYLGPCCVTAGSKPFVYEYRSVSIYDSMSYGMPAGFDFVSATISYSYTTGPATSATKTVSISPVNPGASTLVFNIRALFESGALPYGDQGSSLTATVNIRPNCGAQAKSVARIYIRQIATPGSTFTLTPYTTLLYDTVYLTSPQITATASNSTVAGDSSTVSWEVQVSNSGTAAADSVWLGKDTIASGVTITGVQLLTGAGGTVVSTIAPTGSGIYRLGHFGQTSKFYRVTATYSNCSKDSLMLAYWYDCSSSGYPATVSAQPYRKNIPLTVVPQQAALQLNISSQPDPASYPNLCDTLWYTLEVLNAGPGNAYNLKVTASLPTGGGINFVPGTYTVTYPSTGSAASISNAQVALSGSTLTFTIPAANVARLVANERMLVRFGLQTSCGFLSGQTVRFSPSGTTSCGAAATGIAQQSEKLNMAGVPPSLNLYALYSGADSAAQTCDTTQGIYAKYRFKIVNQGPLATSVADLYSIQLPTGWQLDTTSVAYPYNVAGAHYDSYASGVYYFRTGIGLAVGDSVVMTATLFVPPPQSASVPAGSTPLITENAVVMYNGFCSTTGTYCPVSRVIVGTNQSTSIPVGNPHYGIRGISLQQTTSRDTSISGTVTLRRATALYAPQKVRVSLYKDFNANGTVDATDSLLGSQSLTVADSVDQTLRFNINSPYAAALCPQIIAVANYGCYTTQYVYQCSAASVFYSVKASAASVAHCENPAFNVQGTGAYGKWVLDSGAAIIATPQAVSSAVTVPHGRAARLVWIAYAPGGAGSTMVIADTVRLYNDAKPYFTYFTDTTVCLGQPSAFHPQVQLDSATPKFQWYKNGVLLSGATAQNYTVSATTAFTDSGLYTLHVYGNRGCDTSGDMKLSVLALPSATIAYAGPYCATGSAAVTQTGQTGGTYTALPSGLSINASTGAINLASSSAGTYTVTYTFTNGSCSNTTTAPVVVSALATATISYAGSPYCPLGTANVTQSGQAGGSYSSTTGLSVDGTTGAINLGASTAGTYTVTYSFSNGTCPNTTSASVTVYAAPVVTITSPAAVCAPATIDLTAAAVTAGSDAGLTFTYFTNAGATTALSNPNAVAVSGTYYIKGTNANGCFVVKPVTVTINPLPVATISYAGSPFCATGTAPVTQTGQGGGAYGSTSGLSIDGTTGAINLATSTAGTYTVTYNFTNGTCANTTTTTVTINALPTATISYAGSPYCATGTASVTRTGQTGGSYSSTTGLSINASTGAVNLTASTAGTYTVTYSFTNGTCPNTATTTVTVNALPTLTITSPAAVCAPGTVDLTAAAVTAGSDAGLTYTYFTDAAATTTLSNPNAVSASGTYYIKGSNGNGCFAVKPVTVTIYAAPTIVITNPAPVCAPATVDLTAAAITAVSTSGLVYTYFTDAAATTTLANPSAVATGGTYFIKGTNGNGCSDIKAVTVTINPLPAATIAYTGNPYCATGSASVTQTGQTGGTYSSTAGLSINASTGAINLATSTAGTYTVTYSFTNGTCANTTTTTVTVNALPVATITYAGSPYCATGTASVTQTGQGGGAYSSTAGLAIDASTGAIDLAASTPGTYIVAYSFTNGTCTNTATTTVTINALPTATISYAGSPYCATGTASVTRTGQTGGTYSSTTGLSINASTGAINLAASTAGTYTVTYSFTDGTCSNTATTTVSVNALPTASIAYTGTPYCTHGTASVVQTGQTGGVYSAAPAGLSIDASTGTIDLTASAEGDYTITYTFSDGTCGNSTTAVVKLVNPVLVTHDPAAVCYPNTVDLTAPAVTSGSAGALTIFDYYTDAAGTSVLTAPGAVGVAGTYYIRGATSTGCQSSLQPVNVTILTKPVVTAAASGQDICLGSNDTLTATSPGNTIWWIGQAAGNPVVVTPSSTSTDYYAVAQTADGCSDTTKLVVTAKKFDLTLSGDPNPVVAGYNVTLTTAANFTYSVLAWSPEEFFTDQTALSQTIMVKDTSKTFAVIARSDEGCLDTATLKIEVEDNLGDFFIPNAFTPNGDGTNDIFRVFGSSVKEVHMRIFNQWGQLLYEGTDPQRGWDGSFKGDPQPAGPYLYVIKAVFFSGREFLKRGSISLIR